MCYLKPLWFYRFFNNVTFWIFLFTVNISLYYFPINVYSAGNFWMLLMTKLKSELKTGIFSLVLSYIIDNWCTVVQLLKLCWALKSGLSWTWYIQKFQAQNLLFRVSQNFWWFFYFSKTVFIEQKALLKYCLFLSKLSRF